MTDNTSTANITTATPTLTSASLLLGMDSFPDFLLLQLQQRLLVLAGNECSEEEQSALAQLVSLLYHAQKSGKGAVSTPTLAECSIDISALMSAFPHIISEFHHALQPRPKTPIVAFGNFVAFRRDWLQLADTVVYLQRGGRLNFPSEKSLQTIRWQLGNGARVSDEQKRAAISIAALPFCVVTGGAGTGKTTTLAKGLELLLLDNPDVHIILAAPTGKAAHRLNESLAAQMESIHRSVVPSLQSLKAQTIHRVLGISEHSGRPFYHEKNPLRCDVIAIDEASMIGGDIFTLLQRAVLPHTRIVLLGDANQLPAIDSTAFFNDISRLKQGCDAEFCAAINQCLDTLLSPSDSPLPNAICQLSVSRRFAEQSIIEKIASAILQRRPEEIFKNLGDNCLSLSTWGRDFVFSLASDYPSESAELLDALAQRIILCANRRGIFGSENVNRYLDKQFRKRLSDGNHFSPWYTGRRIMVEQNDYQLGIYNGDIGQCQWRDNNWVIVFDDGRQLAVDELLEEKYSLAFAISIHKSQGSEYPHVDIVLDSFDAKNPNQLVNQSLLYTAVTRAKKTLRLYSDRELVEHALLADDTGQSPLQELLS